MVAGRASDPDLMKAIEEAFEWDDPVDVILALVHYTYETMEELQWEELPYGFRIALLVNGFDSEVANGGFHQFLWNPAGDYTLETLKILKEIGAVQGVQLLEQALAVFPNRKPPEDYYLRDEQIRRLNEEQTEHLSKLSEAYYQQDEDLFEVAASYLKQHKYEFITVHLIYLDDGLLLSKKRYSNWREIQDEFDTYVASLGPWSISDVIDFFQTDRGVDDARWPFRRHEMLAFACSPQTVLTAP
jgi:hypothetical protein